MKYADDVGKAICENDTEINGWVSNWEFPGFVCWTHPEYNCQVAATPWFDSERHISVQVQDFEGNFIHGFDIRLEWIKYQVEWDVKRYLEAMKDAWDEIDKIVEPYQAPNQNPLWDDNHVQYVRLLAEIQAFMTEEVIQEVAFSMDLEPDDVNEVLDRAVDEFEKIKAENCP